MFLAPALDQASQLKLAELKEKVGSLERLLERDVANTSAAAPVTSSSLDDRALPEDKDDNIPAAEDEEGLVPTPLSVLDAAYGDEGDRDGDHNDDLLLDLGIQMGKMRVTDRIGGFFRPKISNEVGFVLFCLFCMFCFVSFFIIYILLGVYQIYEPSNDVMLLVETKDR